MSTNQRDSYRCPSSEAGQKAVLKWGRQKQVVELLDQSRGGFAVSSPRRIWVRPNQVVALRTDAGWSEAEVIHVHRENQQVRIGLRRLGELLDPRQTAALHRSSVPQITGLEGLTAPGWSLSKLTCLSVVLVGVLWVFSEYVVW